MVCFCFYFVSNHSGLILMCNSGDKFNFNSFSIVCDVVRWKEGVHPREAHAAGIIITKPTSWCIRVTFKNNVQLQSCRACCCILNKWVKLKSRFFFNYYWGWILITWVNALYTCYITTFRFTLSDHILCVDDCWLQEPRLLKKHRCYLLFQVWYLFLF